MTVETISKKVKFLVDREGHRTHAVLPIKDFEELLEDISDLAVVASRRDEGSISLAELKRRLYGKEEVPS